MASATKVLHSIPPVSPQDVFPGPRAFKVEESNLFFGREREGEQLTDLLLTYQDVLLYAQSGAGKTSLINARLVPQLGIENCHVARVGGELPPGILLATVPNIFCLQPDLQHSPGCESNVRGHADDAGRLLPDSRRPREYVSDRRPTRGALHSVSGTMDRSPPIP
jgi:hypothetical protein